MNTQITCVQCENVIPEGETVSAVRIQTALQALCEKCVQLIPRRWRSTPGSNVIYNKFTTTIHMAMRDSAAKTGFKLADPRFRTQTRIIREFLPKLSLNGHEA